MGLPLKKNKTVSNAALDDCEQTTNQRSELLRGIPRILCDCSVIYHIHSEELRLWWFCRLARAFSSMFYPTTSWNVCKCSVREYIQGCSEYEIVLSKLKINMINKSAWKKTRISNWRLQKCKEWMSGSKTYIPSLQGCEYMTQFWLGHKGDQETAAEPESNHRFTKRTYIWRG